MKVSAFLLLFAGWFLVLAAVVILPSPPSRAVFALTGMGVEILGLVFAFRSHAIPREEKR